MCSTKEKWILYSLKKEEGSLGRPIKFVWWSEWQTLKVREWIVYTVLSFFLDHLLNFHEHQSQCQNHVWDEKKNYILTESTDLFMSYQHWEVFVRCSVKSERPSVLQFFEGLWWFLSPMLCLFPKSRKLLQFHENKTSQI